VFPISTRTATLRKPIRIGAAGGTVLSPAIAITPDGTTAYVLAQRSRLSMGFVVPISTATDTTLKPIRVGDQAVRISITPEAGQWLPTDILAVRPHVPFEPESKPV
jgi:DNA-binding beta-propeller fold protein YncE